MESHTNSDYSGFAQKPFGLMAKDSCVFVILYFIESEKSYTPKNLFCGP